MVSINDVAERAGVAKSTVSKVLNNYPRVSEEAKEKVWAAVKELGYVPNVVAVSLSKKEFNRIGVIVDIRHTRQFVDEIMMQYLVGTFDKAKEYSIDVVTFFYSQFVDMTTKEISSYFKSQRINSLLIFGLSESDTNLKKLIENQEFCTVVIDSAIVNEKTSSVSIDNMKAQYDVAKATIEKNKCRKNNRVLYIAGGKKGYVSVERLNGMKKLAEEQNFKLIVRYGMFSEILAREIMFKNAKKVDVVVCASDIMAIGAIYALTEMDLFIHVCGFDGITLMGYAKIPMNTIKQDFIGMAKLAFDELMSLLDGNKGRHLVAEYKMTKITYMDVIQ